MPYTILGMLFKVSFYLDPSSGNNGNILGIVLYIIIGLCLLVVILFIYMSIIIKYRDIKIYDKEGKLN